jgi:hypothetical protein
MKKEMELKTLKLVLKVVVKEKELLRVFQREILDQFEVESQKLFYLLVLP